MTTTNPIRLNYSQKLAQTASSLSALALIPISAQAGIIYHSAPLDTVSLGAAGPVSVNWDVDGDGNTDFRLWKDTFSAINLDSYKVSTSNSLLSFPLNGRGMVQPQGVNPWFVSKLAPGFVVGPALAAGFQFSPYSRSYRTALSVQNGIGVVGSNFNSGGFTGSPPEYFGFSFTGDGTNLFFGWADINIDTANKAVTINCWGYNDQAGGSIDVNDTGGSTTPCGTTPSNNVPEPSTASLVLLGLGAGGLRAWRERKKQALVDA